MKYQLKLVMKWVEWNPVKVFTWCDSDSDTRLHIVHWLRGIKASSHGAMCNFCTFYLMEWVVWILIILFIQSDSDAFLCVPYGVTFEKVSCPFCVTVIAILKKKTIAHRTM